MATSGAAVNCITNGRNLVSAVKTIGVNDRLTDSKGRPVSPEQQQFMLSAQEISKMEKGSNVSVSIVNNHATDTQPFRLFDCNNIALGAGAADNGDDIEITTTFAGGTSYANFRTWLNGSHIASIGTMFEFSEQSMISSTAIKVWNGNLEDYNSKALKNYFFLAKDTYSNDPKVLVMGTTLYLNGFLALSGSLPAQKRIDILFNVTLFNNY